MEAFNFAVGLGSAGSGLFDHGAGGVAGSVPQSGFVAAAVVGDDALWGDPDRGEPVSGSGPEPSCGDGFLVVEDLAVGDAGTVVEGAVDVPVPGSVAVG